MEIKFTNVVFHVRKTLLKFVMRTFIFLFCTAIFGFTSNNAFTQNAKIEIKTDQTITVEEVFDLISQQTNYTFIYRSDMFKGLPKSAPEKRHNKSQRTP